MMKALYEDEMVLFLVLYFEWGGRKETAMR